MEFNGQPIQRLTYPPSASGATAPITGEYLPDLRDVVDLHPSLFSIGRDLIRLVDVQFPGITDSAGRIRGDPAPAYSRSVPSARQTVPSTAR
jgi:hypothetical protein